MGNLESVVVAARRLRLLARYGAATVAGFVMEAILGVDNLEILLGTLLILGLIGWFPFDKIPGAHAWFFGIPIYIGFVDAEGRATDEPPSWRIDSVRPKQQVELETSGEVGHRLLEVPLNYQVTFCDDTGMHLRWEDMGTFNNRRRYATPCFGNYRKAIMGGARGMMPLREQIIIRRISGKRLGAASG
ncbi:MAG: hypothetical protein OXG33_01550 [Chloroflexi bacterium]|nr:hypothetical protein [Chloroflexota bacterium]